MKRLRLLPAIATIATIILTAVSCTNSGHNSDVTVPKPVGYPRVDVPDSAYTDTVAGNVIMKFNESTDIYMSPSSEGMWINADYRMFSSPKLYLTLSYCGPEKLNDVLDNRRERISLNLGGNRYELIEFATPSGWDCDVIVARGVLTTPVQLLAHDGKRVLSGTVALTLPDSITDPLAIAPVIDAIEQDVTVLLKGLRDE